MSILSLSKKILSRSTEAKKEKKTEPKKAAKKDAKKQEAVVATVLSGELNLSVIMSEKSIRQQGDNTLVVRVRPWANKQQVAKALKERFNVTALNVRTSMMHPKTRRRGMSQGTTTKWKKAYVRVDDISKINLAP